RWISDNGVPRYDAEKNFTGYIGSCMDVTESISNQQALRESEERMSLAMDAANLGLWEWDVSKDQLWGTKARLALLGLPTSGAITLEDGLSTVHADDRDRVRRTLKDAARTGEDYHLEYRVVLPDGSVRWTDHRGRCVKGPDGKDLILRGISMDVTERKRAEEEFRMAVEASPSGILLVNETGQIVLVNSHIEELFGYGREELMGRTVEILVPERFAHHHPEHRAKFFAAPTARPMGAGRELFGRRKDGSEFPVEIALNPIETSRGVLILAVVVDISARKRAEEEAQLRRDEINRLMRISLVGEMAGSIAHEVNQPLGAMMANASAGVHFIDRGDVDAQRIREILAAVVADGRRARDVINNVRDTIKKGAVVRPNVALNDIVTNVMHMVEPDAAALSCELRSSLAEHLPTIEADPVQIQQVLINLIGNAFDAMREMPPANRKIEIATQLDDGLVCVTVRDHGPGIGDTGGERLFEQFYTTKEEGLGMGLAIVRSIIQGHSGTIKAENAEGGGARFVFALPVSDKSLE
ncbi:MAG TPA: PAS domain S-box protein, partial [Terriglobales bacterium]|nr:PAS domain S-box protein [Terriglobales bacterium]